MQIGRTILPILPYFLISAPVVFSLLYVRAFGVNVVVRDQWEVATLFGELSSGTLSLADLWAPHNEHRFFFPRIVMLALGSVTQWNTIAEMYLIQVCLLATLVVLFFTFRRTVGYRTILFVPVAFLVFSLRQRTNLLWGYQITFAMTLASTVLALFLLYVSGNRYRNGLTFLAALLCATVATGSSIQGLLVWPAGLVQLALLSGKKRPKTVMLALWSLAGLTGWIFYFLGFGRRGESPGSPVSLLTTPFSGAEYFLTVLGNSLTSRQGAVVLVGALLLALTVIALFLVRKSGRSEDYAFWISLLAFSLLVLATITVGRIELDTQSALASRYTTFSLLAVTSLYAIFTGLLTNPPAKRASFIAIVSLGLLLTVLAPSVTISYKNAIQLGAQERIANETAAAALRAYEARSNQQLEILHRNPETVRRRAPILERLDYNVFAADGR